jgi:hypothetical protein
VSLAHPSFNGKGGRWQLNSSQKFSDKKYQTLDPFILFVEDHGDVKLSAQDMGHLVRDAWFDSDCEHWVNVQGIEAKRLLFTPLRDKFQNSAHAVTDFKAFC